MLTALGIHMYVLGQDLWLTRILSFLQQLFYDDWTCSFSWPSIWWPITRYAASLLPLQPGRCLLQGYLYAPPLTYYFLQHCRNGQRRDFFIPIHFYPVTPKQNVHAASPAETTRPPYAESLVIHSSVVEYTGTREQSNQINSQQQLLTIVR